MTRWNASASTFTILHLLFTLSQPTFAAAFRFHARHDGKSHKNHIHRDIEARQNIPNAPFAGISIISEPAATLSSPTPAATTASSPPEEQFDTISAMDTAGFGGAAAPSMASMSAASTSSSQATTIDPLASPVFPITVIQVPIYTICPDALGYTNLTSTISSNATAQYSNATAAAGNATQNTSPTPLPINATPTLISNTSSPVPPSSSSISPKITAPPNARIVLNPNGCQTLYSASTTQICSTVITRGGQLPISVTDCSQWVTFSSSILAATAAVIPTPTPTTAEVCNCPNIPIPVASQLLGGSESGDGCADVIHVLPTAPNINISDPFMPNRPEIYTGTNPIALFVAPWHVIAAGAIPSVVQVVSGNNNTSTERWSVSTSTSIVTGVRTVGFEGPAIAIRPPLQTNTLPPLSPQSPFLPQSATTTTTSISYTTTQTTTSTLLIPTIIRAALTTNPPSTVENIITVQMTIPRTETRELEAVGNTGTGVTQQGQGQVVTEMVTVTVPRRSRYTSTVVL